MITAAFERIAVNEPPMASQRSVQVLLDRGLIEEAGQQQIGRDALGPITITVYEVPIPVHMQWCQWCSENVADEEPAQKRGG